MDVFVQGLDALGKIVVAVGTGFAIWGAINLFEGYGHSDSAAKLQGMKQIMAGGGIIVIGLKVIPLLKNLFV